MPSILDRFEPYLIDRWLAGCHNGLQLYREMIGRDYTGSRASVSRWVAQRRRHEPDQRAAPVQRQQAQHPSHDRL